MYTVLHLGVNDPDGEYEDIQSTFMKIMIQTYKSSAGGIIVPLIDADLDSRLVQAPYYENVIFFMITFLWAVQ